MKYRRCTEQKVLQASNELYIYWCK